MFKFETANSIFLNPSIFYMGIFLLSWYLQGLFRSKESLSDYKEKMVYVTRSFVKCIKKAAWINYSANTESKISDFNHFFKVQRGGKKGFKYNIALILYLCDSGIKNNRIYPKQGDVLTITTDIALMKTFSGVQAISDHNIRAG